MDDSMDDEVGAEFTVSLPPQQTVTSKWKDILEAASHNDTAAVESFIEKNVALVRQTDKDERTIAHIAVDNDYLPLLQYIFENHGSVVLYYPDDFGNTVLQQAIEKNRFSMVKYLVDVCRWNVSKPNVMLYGDTPIHVAAAEGRLDMFKYFIEQKKGDPNIQNGLGDPPAFAAAEKSRLDIVKYLYEESGADMTTLNNHKCNILHSCAKSGDLRVPKYLLDEKKLPIDVDWRDINNCTVVLAATRHSNHGFVEYMVREQHADLNIADELGRTPLHAAAHLNDFPLCRFLVNNGADLRTRDAYNITPLEEATQPQLIGFLDQTVRERVRRVRRNVPLAQRLTEPVPSKGRVYPNMCDGDTNGIRISADRETDRSYSALDSFLIVVDSIIRYMRGASRERHQISFSVSSSPHEIVRDRIDPLAIEVVNNSCSVLKK